MIPETNNKSTIYQNFKTFISKAKWRSPTGNEYKVSRISEDSKALHFVQEHRFAQLFSSLASKISMRKLLENVQKYTDENFFQEHQFTYEEEQATLKNMTSALSNAIDGRRRMMDKLKTQKAQKLIKQIWSFTNLESMEEHLNQANDQLDLLKKKIQPTTLNASEFFDDLIDPSKTSITESWLMAVPCDMPVREIAEELLKKLLELNDEIKNYQSFKDTELTGSKLETIDTQKRHIEQILSDLVRKDLLTKDQLDNDEFKNTIFKAIVQLYQNDFKSKDHILLKTYSPRFNPEEILVSFQDQFVQKEIKAAPLKTNRKTTVAGLRYRNRDLERSHLDLLQLCKLWIANDSTHKQAYKSGLVRYVLNDFLSSYINSPDENLRNAVKKEIRYMRPLPPVPGQAQTPLEKLSAASIFNIPVENFEEKMKDISSINDSDVYEENLSELATNLTLEFAIAFSKIKSHEFWQGNEPNNLNHFVGMSKDLMSKIILNITDVTFLEDRVKLISSYIDLAEKLHQEGDNNSCYYILEALKFQEISTLITPSQKHKLATLTETVPAKELIPILKSSDTLISNQHTSELVETQSAKKTRVFHIGEIQRKGQFLGRIRQIQENLSLSPGAMTYQLGFLGQ